VVVVEEDRIETRSSATSSAVVANGRATVTMTGPKEPLALGEPVALSGKAPGAKEVEILLGSTVLGTCPAGSGAWRWTGTSALLGMGTVSLVARAKAPGGPAVRSLPLALVVSAPAPPRPVRPVKPVKPGAPAPGYVAGLRAVLTESGKKPREFAAASLTRDDIAKQAGPLAPTAAFALSLDGEFEVASEGTYQFYVSARGDFALEIDGRPLADVPSASPARMLFPVVALAAGWHRIELRLSSTGTPELHVLRGGDVVTAPLSALRHR
jgi:hypothetical protein